MVNGKPQLAGIAKFFPRKPKPRRRGRPKGKVAKHAGGRPPKLSPSNQPQQRVIKGGGGLGKPKVVPTKPFAPRNFYGSTNDVGKLMAEIVHEYSVNGSMYTSIRAFSRKMAVKVFGDVSKAESIRQRLGKNKKKRRKAKGDARENAGLLTPHAREGVCLSPHISSIGRPSTSTIHIHLSQMIPKSRPLSHI